MTEDKLVEYLLSEMEDAFSNFKVYDMKEVGIERDYIRIHYAYKKLREMGYKISELKVEKEK